MTVRFFVAGAFALRALYWPLAALLLAVFSLGTISAQEAEDVAADTMDEVLKEVVVKGFRGSLNASLSVKC